MARILLELEQRSLHEQIREDQWPWPHPAENLPGVKYLNEVMISTYICPSVPMEPRFAFQDASEVWNVALTNYLGVNGTDQFRFDGILHVNSQIAIADVRDGTSNTLLVGERPPSNGGFTGWWFAGSGLFPWFGAGDVVLGSNERIARDYGNGFESRPDGEQSRYQKGELGNPYDFEDLHAWHFWSFHPGGSNFLFADGHIQFIKYTIAPNVLGQLATRKGGEAVSQDAY
jgi:prepilin-type processing-associated H-X9-DG protein